MCSAASSWRPRRNAETHSAATCDALFTCQPRYGWSDQAAFSSQDANNLLLFCRPNSSRTGRTNLLGEIRQCFFFFFSILMTNNHLIIQTWSFAVPSRDFPRRCLCVKCDVKSDTIMKSIPLILDWIFLLHVLQTEKQRWTLCVSLWLFYDSICQFVP